VILLSKPFLYGGAALAIVGALGFAGLRINNAAFDRGQAHEQKRTQDALATLRKTVIETKRETEGMSDEDLKEWFKQKCLDAGGSPAQCS